MGDGMGPGARIHLSPENLEEVASISDCWPFGDVAGTPSGARRLPTKPLLPRWPSGSTTASGESLEGDCGDVTPSSAVDMTPKAWTSASAGFGAGGDASPARRRSVAGAYDVSAGDASSPALGAQLLAAQARGAGGASLRPRSQGGLRRTHGSRDRQGDPAHQGPSAVFGREAGSAGENGGASGGRESALSRQGPAVTAQNVRYGLQVVRVANHGNSRMNSWEYRGPSGGSQQEVGKVLGYDLVQDTATVHWHTTGTVCDSHRLGEDGDLRIAPPGQGGIGDRDPFCGGSPSVGATPGAGSQVRRNSQGLFARKSQTCILFDWDDTLFPTAHLRTFESFNRGQLAECHAAAYDLVQLAGTLGRVVIVTLAQPGWVQQCCNKYFPRLGQLMRENSIKVVYARGQDSDQSMRSFANMKAQAIASELTSFYSQYEGQSWKNVLSIGDSDFERDGTRRATADYVSSVNSRLCSFMAGRRHVRKVRTKTFKLAEAPSMDELVTEMGMLQKWLPAMVALDDNLDLELEDARSLAQIRAVEATLQGVRSSGYGRRSSASPAPASRPATPPRCMSPASRPGSPAARSGSPHGSNAAGAFRRPGGASTTGAGPGSPGGPGGPGAWAAGGDVSRRPETPGSPTAMSINAPLARSPAWQRQYSPGRGGSGVGSPTFRDSCF
eukprot:TRINITY_DN5050_c0_g1_i2.p1 TRINITY_DN5050_c0_g1~~TRINITY_DN5050_c0_g1_i2.p1  ORF type:complete len:769 (-),score=126.29 TRINITY_DN5050_c0_g1_i2:85-2094(-)